MKGYKALNKDWTYMESKYEIGKTYTREEEPTLYGTGFLFCRNPIDVFGYASWSDNTIIVEVEALGDILQEGTEFWTNKIKIIREFTKEELKDLIEQGCGNDGVCNTGDFNIGDLNSGDFNTGNWNSGNYNSGNHNSGNYNSGDVNIGFCNSGSFNIGYGNSGSHNSGDGNSGNDNIGDFNSGDFNAGNHNNGFFNSTEQTVRLFNYDSGMTYDEFTDSMPYGFLWEIRRKRLSKESIEFLKNLPHFDAEVFKKCTGIELK